jgi:hypothetical protein
MHRRTHFFILAALLIVVGRPTTATAQMTYTYEEYGERGVPTSSATNYLVSWPLSLDECEADRPISMVITSAPFDATGMTTLQWDLWQGGTGTTGANCQMATNRRGMGGATALCTQRPAWSGGGQLTTTMPTLTFRPRELFPAGCSDAGSGTFVFYAMAVSARGDTTTDVAATHFFAFNVALDLQPPMAPMLEDAAGDRQIAVAWTNVTSETLSGARVYVDTSATCGASTLLVGGAAAPATLTPAATISGSAPTSASLDGSTLGLAIGESAPMAVTVLDTARNESVLSNVACVERVPVEGFWDAYCRERMLSTEECDARYSGCSALPGDRRHGAAWLVLVALGLASARLRRKGGER